MAEQSRFSPDTFLSAVRRQLKGLDAREQREILEELQGHLEDPALRFAEDGASSEAAMERAAAEMGDPSQVGRRLREEHMSRSLPLLDAFLAGAPFLAVPLWLITRRVTFPLSTQLPWIELVGTLAVLGAVAGLCLWSLRRGQRIWLATLSGTVGIFGVWFVGAVLYGAISPLVRVVFPGAPNGILQSWMFNAFWVVLAFIALPAVTMLVRWGSSQATLAIFAALGNLVLLAWDEGFMTWLKVVAYMLPYFGLVALIVVPRRLQALTAWAVLLTDWILCVLSMWYYRAYGAPEALQVANPARIEDFWNPSVLSTLFFAMVLLFWSQGVAIVRARRA